MLVLIEFKLVEMELKKVEYCGDCDEEVYFMEIVEVMSWFRVIC